MTNQKYLQSQYLASSLLTAFYTLANHLIITKKVWTQYKEFPIKFICQVEFMMVGTYSVFLQIQKPDLFMFVQLHKPMAFQPTKTGGPIAYCYDLWIKWKQQNEGHTRSDLGSEE